MSANEKITQELSFGDLVSKTFELHRRDFVKYVTLFLVVEAIVGVLTTLIRLAIIIPAVPSGTSSVQNLNWLPGFFGAIITLVALTAIVSLVFYPVAFGGAVKIASDDIAAGQSDLAASVRFAFSKIVWIWVVGIVTGIIVTLGFIALVIPGIILAIMFSLVLPVIIIEGSGIESIGRSRKLVSQRWLKTFALFIVFAIIIGIAAAIVSVISGFFGVASTIVSSILSAFYLPLIPIVLTLYYYSNVARLTPAQITPPPFPGAASQVEMKYCPSCGTRLPSTTMFCPTCGAKQFP